MMENKKEGTKPYEDCEYKGNHCHVNDRFQRLPRSEGGLGMCIKIGGYGN
jgi:hypothetical protein